MFTLTYDAPPNSLRDPNLGDAPPHSLKDSNASLKVKTTKGIGVCSLACSISGVKGCVGVQG